MTAFAKFLREIEPLLLQRGSAWRHRVLAPMEWSDTAQGQGTMSQDHVATYPACPSCGGIHESGSHEFVGTAIGHQPNCALKKFMERE